MATGFSFGSSLNKPSTGGGFSFGTNTATVAPFNANSGISVAPTATSNNSLFGTQGQLFNTNSTSSTATTGGLFSNLNAPKSTSAATGFSFNPTTSGAVSSAATGFSFNLGATSAAGTSNAGGGLIKSLQTPATSTTNLFGALNPTSSATAAPLGGGGLFSGLNSTATSASGGGLLFGGAKPLSGVSGGLFGSNSTPTSTPATIAQFKGLGGSDAIVSSSGGNNQNNSTQEPKLAKEANVPPELVQHVEALKKHVEEEKKYRDEISRNSSVKPLFQIQNDISGLRNETVMVFSVVQRSLNHANNIKEELNRELKNYEMITRVRDTPIALQDMNYNPITYFHNKANIFFTQMANVADQLQIVERFLTERQDVVTAEDFVIGLHRINETFVSLVANYQQIQECVAQMKSDFLRYRKLVHRDSTDVFQKLHKQNVSLNLKALSPSKYSDFKTLEEMNSSGRTAAVCTVGPTNFTNSTSETTANNPSTVPSGLLSSNVSTGLGSSSLVTGFGSSPSTGGGLFGTGTTSQSPFGVTFASSATSLASKPGTKRNKSK